MRLRVVLDEDAAVDPLVAAVVVRLALWARDGRAVDPMELLELVSGVLSQAVVDGDRV